MYYLLLQRRRPRQERTPQVVQLGGIGPEAPPQRQHLAQQPAVDLHPELEHAL